MTINTSIAQMIFNLSCKKGLLNKSLQNKWSNYFQTVEAFVPIAKGQELFEDILDDDNFKFIGTEIGREMIPMDLGILGYFLHACKHLFIAHEKLSQYQELISDVVNFHVDFGDNKIHWYLTTPLSYNFIDTRISQVVTDLSMAFRHGIVEHLIGQSVTPVSVSYNYLTNDAEVKAIHQELFGCPVLYGKPFNSIVYRFEDVYKTIPTTNTETYRALEPELKNLLDQTQGRRNYTLLVGRIIRSNIGLIPLTLKNVAYKTNMSARNLQRQLQSEGTTFQSILDEALKEVVRIYKAKGFSPKEIANTLGYQETNSFLRAYKRWFGQNFSQHKMIVS